MHDFIFSTIFLLPFFSSLFAALVITPIAIWGLKKINLFDDPVLHKHPAILHTKPIPRGGGIPLFLAILLPGIFLLPFSLTVSMLLFAGLLALIVGVLDDKYDISPYIRFGANVLVAIIVVGSGVSIPFITNPLGGILHLSTTPFTIDILGRTIHVIADGITIVWIVWIMNMLNWSKGVDGQMPGIVAISAVAIGILSLRFSITDINTVISAKLSFMIAGASIGFLFYNFYPAKIFPGYGATAMYLLLSVVAILSGAKLATAILVMGVPLTDGTFTIARRIITGRSPFWHDKKHLHHLLLHLGLSQRTIALSYWLFSAILGALALVLSSRGKLFAILMLLVIVGGALLFLHVSLKSHENERI